MEPTELEGWITARHGAIAVAEGDGVCTAAVVVAGDPPRRVVGCGSNALNAVYDLYCELVPPPHRRPVPELVREGWEVRRRELADATPA